MPRVLAIVSHVVHYAHAGRLYAYGPYAREIDVWADLFPEIVIVSPLRREAPPGDALPFERRNITVRPQRESGGTTLGAKLRQVALLPALVADMWQALRGVDAIHVRCPGNLGLVGLLVAPLRSRRLVAKFAGQWNGYPGEARTVRAQRALLRSRWWRGPVTVYGEWPNQPRHVVPFFTSVLTREQLARARAGAARRQRAAVGERQAPERSPLRILFVGRLSAARKVDVLLDAVAAAGDLVAACTIVGDGPERAALEARAAALGVAGRTTFVGAVPLEAVFDHYEASDVLVLAAQTEGWGKAVVEAMAFGLVCVGSDRGPLPQILGDGRGHVVPADDVPALVAALRRIGADPAAAQQAGRKAAVWAERYSLEALGDALAQLLGEWWHVPFAPPSAARGAGGRAAGTHAHGRALGVASEVA